MSALRIFSYLPNPRIAKATIVGRLCGVEVEVRGASPKELQDWLWDFDAHPLAPNERETLQSLVRSAKTGFSSQLFKTDAFLNAHPFGTVPAAFSPDGAIGIFESNSIMRAVARLGKEGSGIYGGDAYTASRIDSFLDASLMFARDTQIYILALMGGIITVEVHRSVSQALATYLTGIERALGGGRDFIVGNSLSLADICFVAEFALIQNEANFHSLLHKLELTPLLTESLQAQFPLALAHFGRLSQHAAIAPDIQPYLRDLPLR